MWNSYSAVVVDQLASGAAAVLRPVLSSILSRWGNGVAAVASTRLQDDGTERCGRQRYLMTRLTLDANDGRSRSSTTDATALPRPFGPIHG